MLQTTKTKQAALMLAPSSTDTHVSEGQNPQCVLPAGAIWCEVRLQNLEPFWMATYDFKKTETLDYVSSQVCNKGFWEDDDISQFGAPGHMLDIGGNIGFFGFAFAHGGWTVTLFEPMAPNLALINATLCQNPNLAAKMVVNPFGLGAQAQQCKMMAGKLNRGNGHTVCEDAKLTTGVHIQKPDQLVEVGNFSIRRLDEVLVEQGVSHIELVKIDVEGDQSQVFAGAPNLLAQYHPRLIKSEVWWKMVGSAGAVDGVDYLAMFENAGYKFFADNRCQTPLDAKTEVSTKGGIESLIICK